MKAKLNLEGQLSIFDIPIIEKPISFTKIAEKVTETKVLDTEKPILDTKILDMAIEKYKPTAERIIKIGQALAVEYKDKTIYVNREGKEEFEFNKRIPVHPWNTIIYAKEDIEVNSLQKEKLKDFKEEPLKRHGDENIILNSKNKILSILPNGWVLEYKDLNIDNLEEFKPIDEKLDIRVGSLIEAEYGKQPIIAEITRIYNSGYTCNIRWDKKHTAIAVCGIKRVIRS